MSFRSFQTGDTGAFHLTEIPEILLENQMEHVNFWNAVSKISDNLSRLSTNFTSIKTFPNQVSACFPVFDEQKPPPKPKWRVLDRFGASSLDLFRCSVPLDILETQTGFFVQMESAQCV
jgi:hypothetical protein